MDSEYFPNYIYLLLDYIVRLSFVVLTFQHVNISFLF